MCSGGVCVSETVEILLGGKLPPGVLALIVSALGVHFINEPDGQQIQLTDGKPDMNTSQQKQRRSHRALSQREQCIVYVFQIELYLVVMHLKLHSILLPGKMNGRCKNGATIVCVIRSRCPALFSDIGLISARRLIRDAHYDQTFFQCRIQIQPAKIIF